MVKAIGLFSGGLDSMLACCVLRDQDIELLPLTFTTPFFGAEVARKAARDLDLPLEVMDITERHLVIVKDPPSGHGKNMNPCIDCHALMLEIAGEKMLAEGYDFLFTGEVLGERPMSQNRGSLNRVANRSGFRGRVLRPLSARLLDETLPEQEGKVDRSLLLDLSGRGRSRQIELARHYGIAEYPTPAGGCRLTDPAYSTRLRDLFAHMADPPLIWIRSLALGRHFWVDDACKVVVGRNHGENEALEALAGKEICQLGGRDFRGPRVLLFGEATEENLRRAASLVARYGDPPAGMAPVWVVDPGREEFLVEATAVTDELLEAWRV